MNSIKVSAAQYDIGNFSEWGEFEEKVSLWIEKSGDSDLVVFPEYFSLELVSLFSNDIQKSLYRQLREVQVFHDEFSALFMRLSQESDKVIQAGTFPVEISENVFRNRAYLFTPDGGRQHQDKIQMTRFENESWKISPGEEINILNSNLGKIGIAVCYDVEFPLIVRKMVEQGANVILAPSCTDTMAGYNRVKIGCQARAMENQCYVVQSATVGNAEWSPALDVNIGAAAIFSPIDRGFPNDGISKIGEINEPGWVSAEIDLDALKEVRANGQVLNYRDWDRQPN